MSNSLVSSPSLSRRLISSSNSSNSSDFGRLRPIRRAIEYRIVRLKSSWIGAPSLETPARERAMVSVEEICRLIRSGNSRSSKKRSRNSSRVSTNLYSSVSSCPSSPEAPPPRFSDPSGLFSRSPVEKLRFPARTISRSPPVKIGRKLGSCRESAGMLTASPLPTSLNLPADIASRAARSIAVRARRNTLRRFSRFLPWGLGRRSIMSKSVSDSIGQADCLTRMYHSTSRRTCRSV